MATIFVTGAAGLLGAEIAAELAARGHGVIGLVHSHRTLLRGDREPVAASDWNGEPPPPGTVALVAGDVADPLIGLAAERHAHLAEQIDTIVHCAAVVGFGAAEADYRRVNVEGTRHALALAGPGTGFVQLSTAYVCGQRDGLVAETEVSGTPRFANPYEASKHAAEALVWRAVERRVQAAVARPTIVVGRSSDGAIAHFDAIYQAFRLLATGRLASIPARASATLDFVVLDHAVNGIATIAERIGEAAGRAFHLAAERPMPVGEFFELIASYPQFADPRLIAPEQLDAGRFTPAERRLHRRVAEPYASYFQHNPLFVQENIRDMLGRRRPAVDSGLLRRQIDYCIRRGFLPAPADTIRAPVPRP